MLKPVAIILLNWNTPAHTTNCIESLLKYADNKLFDIIVADNGSTDRSLALLQTRFPDLIYIDNQQNLGFAEGNNRALNYSINNNYTYSLLLNTDTLIDEDIVIKLSSHLNNYPEAAAVQPAIFWMHNKKKVWNGEGSFNELLGITYTKNIDPNRYKVNFKTVKWVSGCCMLLRNSALKQSGPFNEKFFLYYEDVELSYRMRKHGYDLHYLPSCKIYHEAGASAKENSKQKEGSLSPIIHYYIVRNRIWFLRGYQNVFFFPMQVLGSLIYYVTLFFYFKLRKRNQKAGFVIKGLNDGFLTSKNLIWPQNT